jgi:hypothetical protein
MRSWRWTSLPNASLQSSRASSLHRERERMSKLYTFTAGVIAGLAAAAVGQELVKEPAERTWKGKVAGIPYNFNVPEWSSIAAEYWNPESEHIFAPHVIGMGWGINFAAVVNRLQQMSQATPPETRPATPSRQIPASVEQ